MNPLVLFADGASSGNPGPGGWGAILVIPRGETQEIQELGGGDPRTTNNRMELTGLMEALGIIIDAGLPGDPIRIYTDSTYVIQGITQWIHSWKRKGWKTAEGGDVLNRDLWTELDARVAELRKLCRRVEWNHVRGHAGIAGNERADQIAVGFSKGAVPPLYRGPLSGYSVRVLEIPGPEGLARKSPGSAYYLSVVDGQIQRHATWAECETRVKGKSGARYKKVNSEDEERETLRSWGVESS